VGSTCREYVKRYSIMIDMAVEAASQALRKLFFLAERKNEMSKRLALSMPSLTGSIKRKAESKTNIEKRPKTESVGVKTDKPTSTTITSAKVTRQQGLKLTIKMEEVEREEGEYVEEDSEDERNTLPYEPISEREEGEYMEEDSEEDKSTLPYEPASERDSIFEYSEVNIPEIKQEDLQLEPEVPHQEPGRDGGQQSEAPVHQEQPTAADIFSR
jgi:hypothetical protein